MKKSLLLAGVLLSGLAGCASVSMEESLRSDLTKSFSAPADDKAGLYIYRAGGPGAALKKDIWVDGSCVGRSAPKVFFYKEVDANREHVLSTESEFSPNHLTLYTEGGKNYFIQQSIKMGVLVGGAKLRVVDEAAGRKAVEKLGMAIPGGCARPEL